MSPRIRIRLIPMAMALLVLSACGGGDSGGGVNTINPLPVKRGLLPELPVADATFEGDHHAGSGQCAACHTDISMEINTEVVGETRNVSIGTAWETSTMANSARDPYWHAVVAAELDEFPNLAHEINDTCTRCHAPMANDLAKKQGLDLQIFDTGSAEDGTLVKGIYGSDETSELFNHAMDGVSCSLCHQIEGGNLGTEDSFSGGYQIVGSTTGDVKDRPAYGQYDDPSVGYMRQQAGFLPQYGAHISTSETCATCHNLSVEAVDKQGVPVAGIQHFNEQANYTEWLNSDYRTGGPQQANCQGCHMPKVDQAVFIGQGADIKRDNFAEHVFLGANTVMQDMLKNFADELGVQPGLDFDTSIARNQQFLRTSADISINAASLAGSELSFDVNVLNQSGHKLPTGYHSRRVYLHVQVLDAGGQLIFESGAIQPDGSITGVSEDVNPANWEAHHDVITSGTQVQVYQAIVGNSDGERTHSLLNGSFYLKDNRLTPQGFDKVAVNNDPALPSTFGVFGAAVDDPDFNLGSDTVTYKIAVPAGGSYTVLAELRYQPFSFGHLAKLFSRSDRVDQIDMFRTIYDSTERRDEVIDATTATVN